MPDDDYEYFDDDKTRGQIKDLRKLIDKGQREDALILFDRLFDDAGRMH